MGDLVVASEYGEPSKHEDIICQRLVGERNWCLLLISKNLPGCTKILNRIDALKIPIQVHCTITGLGGTKYEPHILAPDLVVEESIRVIKEFKINPEAVTVRIDPLIPSAMGIQIAEAMSTLRAFSEIGVKDCRASIIDYYPHVRKRFSALGIEHPQSFQLWDTRKEELIKYLYQQTNRFNMNLHLCAESIPERLTKEKDIDTEGCASAASWKRLGIGGLNPATRRQRKECTCDLKKEDLLAGLEKGCKRGCAYCYWKADV